MTDEMVLRAQQFINSYNITGIPKVEEDGKTGWPTMYALTRALQYELGISTLSDSFGPTTLATLQSKLPLIDSSNRLANVNRIIQSGLYCKGYDGSGISGTFDDRTGSSVAQLKANMGVADVYPGPGVTPKVLKALLTMDAYVVVTDGTEAVRAVQQWMNGRYVGRKNFFIMPCDGHYSRDVQKALLVAIQFELGVSDDAATGVFGPTTKAGLKAHELSVGSSGIWVQLFSAAMVFNQRQGSVWTSVFDLDLADLVGDFQQFAKLPRSQHGDFQTWASLLVSTGDSTRQGSAADCSTALTAGRANSLLASGYTVVGRYLCNAPSANARNKMLQPGELMTAAIAGLRVFPIYQTYGGSASYFTQDQGVADAYSALDWALFHGFKEGTRIYFAVDFDALDGQVTSSVIPYFRGIAGAMESAGHKYRTGIYGARNVCSRVHDEGLSTASFVSDMSTGYSGNLGYPLPLDWAFDQISTITVGSGSGQLEIDNDIVSGLDLGQSEFDLQPDVANLDVAFDKGLLDTVSQDLRAYLESVGIPEQGGPTDELVTSVNTTTQAINLAFSYDWLLTQLARAYRMRKALIMAPLIWEIRAANGRGPAQ